MYRIFAGLTAFLFLFPQTILCNSTGPEYSKRCYPPDSSSIFKTLQLDKNELRTNTGVYTMEKGGKSLAARLWLFDNATHTIKMQYFSFSRNVSGLFACEHIVRAAERGVKVCLLVDEAAGRLNAYEIKVLDAHENIEIRVYNAGIKMGRIDRRIKKLVANRNRLLRRMHNKTLIIDGQVAITGGRNISDEYFDLDDKYNFRDRDVMLMGKAAGDVDNSFELFWNDKLTVKVEDLLGRNKDPYDVRKLYDKFKKLFNDTVIAGPIIRDHVNAFASEIVKSKSNSASDSYQMQTIEFVSFVSDKPGKNENKTKRKGGITTDTMIALIKSAKKTLDIQSPYFITSDEATELLRETVKRGVKVRILTNSMASTDNPEAFNAYRRDRKKNLATGIELFEFRPDPSVRFNLMLPEVQGKLHYKPVYGLHSKSMIIDGHTSVIGSYNLDPRSANLNTECFAIIRSTKFVEQLGKYINDEYLPANAYPVTAEDNPDSEAPFKTRFKTFFMRILPKKQL